MSKLKFEDFIEQSGQLTYSNVGTSMLPLLRQGRDLFTVSKKNAARCRKYDVVLYHGQNDTYILHRIIKVREADYVIRGDNCITKEYGITDDDIIGVMTGFVRDGKSYSTDNTGYRIYSVLWCAFAPVRICFKKMKIRISHLKRSVKMKIKRIIG
ncbi:MAG: hypothetical protein IJM37_11270 [Lachnospiraceae bacterium]|nr:hypothetical protein [Lachnospiraceae bacterium]